MKLKNFFSGVTAIAAGLGIGLVVFFTTNTMANLERGYFAIGGEICLAIAVAYGIGKLAQKLSK